MKLYENDGIEHKTCIDDLEPIDDVADEVRSARTAAVMLLNRMASHIDMALSRPEATLTDVATAFWQSCYALGLNCCVGLSMTERSLAIGRERATISKGATEFCRAAQLPPSFYMKKESSQSVFRASRNKVVEASQGARKSCKGISRPEPKSDDVQQATEAA